MSYNWDKYFIDMARFIATKSKDPKTKVGCVIVGPDHEIRTTGYNGMPRGLNDALPERSINPEKRRWYEHSERNAIYNSARHGTALKGCTVYITAPPCSDCVRGLIQVGIVEIVAAKDHSWKTWEEHMERATKMMDEAGIIFRYFEEEKDDENPSNSNSGEECSTGS